MFSSEYGGYAGEHTKNRQDTSYTFGAHHLRDAGGYIHYTLDSRVVQQDPARIPARLPSAPAWVIGDLMLSAHRGQPLTPAETALVDRKFDSASLQWLQRTLSDLEK